MYKSKTIIIRKMFVCFPLWLTPLLNVRTALSNEPSLVGKRRIWKPIIQLSCPSDSINMDAPRTTCTKGHSIFVVSRRNKSWNSLKTVCAVWRQCFASANRVRVDWNVPKWLNKRHWRRTIMASFHTDWREWQEGNNRLFCQLLKDTVHMWLDVQLITFHSEGTIQLVHHQTKYLQK
jgi:hypothetical protein